MKLIKIMMACSIFILALTFASCKKGEYSSRDTSGLVPDPVIEEPVDPTLVLFDNCDKLDQWEISGGTGVIETVTKKEGEGALGGRFKATEDYLHFIKRPSTPVNSKLTAENAQLSFWLYLEKTIEIKEGQIEITSSGQADQQEYHWAVEGLSGLKPGWNEIKLNVRDAAAENGGADLGAINWFRMYIITKDKLPEDVKVFIDYIRFNAAAPAAPSLYLDNCDNLTGWEVSGGTGIIDATKKKEGTGSIFGKTHPDNGYLHFKKKFNTPVDTKLTKLTGQLSFWLYISKLPEKLNGQIEITSSGESDQQEYNWDPATIKNLKPGVWNEVKLNIRDAAISNGPVNLGAINFFRMYLQTGEDGIDIGIDGIKFNEIALPEPTLLDACDKLDGWDFAGDMAQSIETAGKKEGTGYIKAKISATKEEMRFAKVFPTNFDSKVTKENGQLTFWFYVERVADFKEIQVQISSTDNIDATRYGWSLLESANLGIPALKDGWNEVKLDISKTSYEADGGANLAAIKFFRIFGFTNAKVTSDLALGLDGIKFVVK